MDILWIARMLLTAGGSALASKGYISADDVQTLAGAGTAIVGMAWSARARADLKKQAGV